MTDLFLSFMKRNAIGFPGIDNEKEFARWLWVSASNVACVTEGLQLAGTTLVDIFCYPSSLLPVVFWGCNSDISASASDEHWLDVFELFRQHFFVCGAHSFPLPQWLLKKSIVDLRFGLARQLLHGDSLRLREPVVAFASHEHAWLGCFWEYHILRVWCVRATRFPESALRPMSSAEAQRLSLEEIAAAIRFEGGDWSHLLGLGEGREFGAQLEFVLNELRPRLSTASSDALDLDLLATPEVLFPLKVMWRGYHGDTSSFVWTLVQIFVQKSFVRFVTAPERLSRLCYRSFFVAAEFGDFVTGLCKI